MKAPPSFSGGLRAAGGCVSAGMDAARSQCSDAEISRIIEMAWEDRTAFEAIARQFGLNDSAMVALMRRHLKPASFRAWRKRMAGRVTKHEALRSVEVQRHRATHTRS